MNSKSRSHGSVFLKAAELMSVEGTDHSSFGACKAIAAAQKTPLSASQYDSRAHKFFAAVFAPEGMSGTHYFGLYEAAAYSRKESNLVNRNREHRVLALLLAAELRNAGFTKKDFQ